MFESIFEWLFKPYIDKLVDKRFQENVIERYWLARAHNTKQRIQEIRESLYSPSQRTPSTESGELLSGGYVYSRQDKPEVQTSADQAAIKRREEMENIKAKLKRPK
jgi:hypothetical protein